MSSRGSVSLHLILTIFLGLGMLLFGVLAVLAYSESEDIKATLKQRVDAAVGKAVDEQKKVDAEENRKANDLPYRTYTAEPVDGGFQLQIPKSWSLVANKNASGTSQLELMSDPNVVINNLANGAINTHAFKFQLLKRSQTETIKYYDSLVKTKKVTSKGVQVSGINATRFDGAIDNQRHTGTVIVFPVRDKTIIMSTENPTYQAEFEKIVSTAKINP